MQSAALVSALNRASILAGSTKTEGHKELQGVLVFRLSQYYATLDGETPEDLGGTLETVQLKTAQEALRVVEEVQGLLNVKSLRAADRGSQSRSPEDNAVEELVGTRDLSQLRTLLSLVFKWSVEPFLARVSAAIPSVTPGGRRRTEVNIIDLTSVPDDYEMLVSTLSQLMTIVLPSGTRGHLSSTHITSAILERYLVDLLEPCIVLGWLPKSLSSESVLPVDEFRPAVIHLINMLPVSRSVTALSNILSDPSALPYVRKTCGYLMSRQILRDDGVRGLFIALFAEEDMAGDDAPLEKLESVSNLLTSSPMGMDKNQYFTNLIYQLLLILSTDEEVSPAHWRAAAFSLSRMMSDEKLSTVTTRILLPALQRPFLDITSQSLPSDDSSARPTTLTPSEAIRTLQTLLTNTDPSPALISRLLTPIVTPLYALSSALESVKTSDPAQKTTVRGLLRTWGRLVDTVEGMATLWMIVDGEGGEWRVNVLGDISRVEQTDQMEQLSLFTPEDLQRAEESGEFDLNANLLNLRPDPTHFIAFVKSLDRSDVASELFVRLLDAYRECKAARDADPLKTLLYLQLVVQMQNQLSVGDSSLDILKKPDHILSFIKHALQTSQQKTLALQTPSEPATNGLKLEDLRIVDVGEDIDPADEGDSDDEDAPSTPQEGSDDEMTSTALTLLLSVLEANPNLNAQTAPILDEIFPVLESLAKESSELIKPLAREARMVLTARMASSSMPQTSKGAATKAGESPQETYQKALKLLQDPILPVRAHGLLLLRQLVSSRPQNDGSLKEPEIDRALVPGILSIFLQSLQDDDSYIFLNAVQGLAAMVDGFGKDVLKSLVDTFSAGLDGLASSTLTQLDLDTRTRVGEALEQVVKRCGDALPSYGSLLIPPLFAVVRASHLPTALRTSALSLLAQCANTSAVAVLPYAVDLTAAMFDLLQVESVTATEPVRARRDETSTASVSEDTKEDKSKTNKQDTAEYQPTTKDSKVPTLRRSALYFLSLLTRAFAAQLDDASTVAVYVLPGDLMRRAKTTVGYVAATDADLVVRVMAKETLEGFDNLAEAMLGLIE